MLSISKVLHNLVLTFIISMVVAQDPSRDSLIIYNEVKIGIGQIGSFDPYYAFPFFSWFLAGILIYSIIISIPMMRRTIRITFEDIRDVEGLIQILITNMGYSFVSKKNGKIEYSVYNYLQRKSIWRVFGKLLGLTTKILKEMNLTIYIDGNTLVLQGMYIHTTKLNKTLKRHIIIN